MSHRAAPADWSVPVDELLSSVGSSTQGLTPEEAANRRTEHPPESLHPTVETGTIRLLIRQFQSPIILILIAAAGLSAGLGQVTDAIIILVIIVASGLLGFWQERGAAGAVRALLAQVQIKAHVLRAGKEVEVPFDQVVPGDILVLDAGDMVAGDCRLIEARDLFINEAALTGETFPVEKRPADLPPETALAARTNGVLLGTHVVSGTGKALVLHTGRQTEFGQIAHGLGLVRPETEFERGIRRFGYLLLEITLVLVATIFAVNVLLARPVLDSFLFSLALAVGLTPQLLPVIITVNLSHGAGAMAARKVIVKRLASIENFGSMNVLCTDKTGTLTEGTVQVKGSFDHEGSPSPSALLYACVNATFETGYTNPIDQALRTLNQFGMSPFRKLDELPYDFIRKRLSILVREGDAIRLITKGAVANVLDVCNRAQSAGGAVHDLESVRTQVEERFREFSSQGCRTIGVATRLLESARALSQEQEADMTFLGFVVLYDPPKAGVADTVSRLEELGIRLKIVTGDNRLVAATVAESIGLHQPDVVTGLDLRSMSDDALVRRADEATMFAEIEPNQKERVLLALKKAGNVVGFVGDGINDASAMHAADVAISVDSAVDVAKEAADIVLLEKNLAVLVDGVLEGRRTFLNTLKYVYIATSANFGNMASMASLSPFLSFLPLLPKQILVTNLLTDFPETAIATDSIDPALQEQPTRWNLRAIRDFMIVFGAISSLFDALTFAWLLLVLHASTAHFRTGWFLESVISASLIVLVVRTRQPLYLSRPSRPLLLSTIAIGVITLVMPWTIPGRVLGFEPIPATYLAGLAVIVAAYIAVAETTKRVFFRYEDRLHAAARK